MATKTIYMNGGMNGDMNGDEEGDDNYVYPNSDDDGEQEQYQAHEEANYDQEECLEFYANLEVASQQELKKTKPRSMSIDSDASELTKKPNFKCGSCKKSFLLDKNQKMIRCSYCGYRILFKLRTRNYITYKTE